MLITKFPKEIAKFEVQVYKKPKNLDELRRTHVPFSGSPIKHPYDSEKIILVTDPYSTSAFYLEFRIDDIYYVEELTNLVKMDGEVVGMTRVWVKKNSVALRLTPFIVEDTQRIRE
ncbi:MAG TPA: inorganic pyrophosphatase Ppa [Desulfobacteraceae bacterium]|nr:inorganic pyrophosphatase Ppa [Desulfobacteraceae bacterium]